jgi:hypothetical protein
MKQYLNAKVTENKSMKRIHSIVGTLSKKLHSGETEKAQTTTEFYSQRLSVIPGGSLRACYCNLIK